MKLLCIAFLITISELAFSQQIQNIEYDYTDENKYTCKSMLYINGKESIFKLHDGRKTGDYGEDEASYRVYNDKWSRLFYDNGTVSLTRIPLYDKELIYQSSPEVIKTTGKSKTIGKFQCQEALVAKGGRNYQVWFAPSVPVSIAPLGIDKLPGLAIEILEIGGEKTNIKLTKIGKGLISPEYQNYKKYILGKNPLTYDVYKKEITKQVTGAKKENLLSLAEFAKQNNIKVEVETESGHHHYVRHLVDIPENLVKDLQKIK